MVGEVSRLQEREISGLSNCPAILVLEFKSIENESPIALAGLGGGVGDPPVSCLNLAFQTSVSSSRIFAGRTLQIICKVSFRVHFLGF